MAPEKAVIWIPIVNIQADIEKMKIEGFEESTYTLQAVGNLDTSVPYLVGGIKQELDEVSEDVISKDGFNMVNQVIQLQDINQPDLGGENDDRLIKNEIFTCTSWRYMDTDIKKVEIESTHHVEHLQLVCPDIVSENESKHIIYIDMAEDLERLPEEIRKFENTEDDTDDFEQIPNHSNTIEKIQNTNSDLCVTYTDIKKVVKEITSDVEDSQLVCPDIVSENESKHIIYIDMAEDLERLPEEIRKFENTEDDTDDFEQIPNHSNTIEKIQNTNSDLCVTYTDIKKVVKEITSDVEDSQLVCPDIVSENESKYIINIEKAEDLERLPEEIRNFENTEYDTDDLEWIPNHSNTIEKIQNTNSDLCVRTREQRLNELIKLALVKECRVMVVDILTKKAVYDDSLSLTNSNCSKLSKNILCVSKKRTVISKNHYKCDICGIYLTKLSNLIRHKKIHTGEKPYKCDICGQFFNQRYNMNMHIKIHTGEKPYKCDVCDARFIRPSHLKLHKRQHARKKQFQCDVCGKHFTNVSNMNVHKVIHTGKKPYKCDMCGVGFSGMSNLRRHIRTHIGKKPCKCNICGKHYASNDHLIKHKRTHTGEKPYKCDLCGIGFSQYDNIKRHVRTHTGEKPCKCDVCGIGFTQISNMKVHSRTHIGEKLYKCEVCGNRFNHVRTLKIHIGTHI